MMEIILTRGKVAIVDDMDATWLVNYSWYAVPRNDGLCWYAATALKGFGHVYMHRMILAPPLGIEADHVNGNGLDNRRLNLRFATREQQTRNSRKHIDSIRPHPFRSRFKGVSLDLETGRTRCWSATLSIGSRRLRRQLRRRFATEEEAAAQYDAWATEYFGVFANTNSTPKIG